MVSRSQLEELTTRYVMNGKLKLLNNTELYLENRLPSGEKYFSSFNYIYSDTLVNSFLVVFSDKIDFGFDIMLKKVTKSEFVVMHLQNPSKLNDSEIATDIEQNIIKSYGKPIM